MTDTKGDRNERAQRRRIREARARKALVAGAILSLATGTATIYAANAGSHGSTLEPPDTVSIGVVVPTSTAIPRPSETPTPVSQSDTIEPENSPANDDRDDENEDDDAIVNVQVPTPTSVPASVPALTPTPSPTPDTSDIVVEQPPSHTRSHSTPG